MISRCYFTYSVKDRVYKVCENEAKFGIMANTDEVMDIEYLISEYCEEHIEEVYDKHNKRNPGRYIKYKLPD